MVVFYYFAIVKFIFGVLIIGALILLKAPGNVGRMAGYEEWYKLNIIETDVNTWLVQVVFEKEKLKYPAKRNAYKCEREEYN